MLAPHVTENLQRVGFLASIPGLLRRFGVDPLEVLTGVGLDAEALDNPDSTIPFHTAGMLVQVSAEKTHCPHFGLEIGKQIRIPTLGLVGELMRNAPNIRAADVTPPVRPSGNTIWTRKRDEQEQAHGGGDHHRAEAGGGRAQG